MLSKGKNIYLAGKIRKNDWRESIIPDIKYWIEGHDIRSIESIANWPILEGVIKEKYNYTGPFFVSCDHGCYHGPNSHGYGAMDAGCESLEPSRN
jgi:hypothetical protein